MAGQIDLFEQLDEDRIDLLARVASMYYEQGMSQRQISLELGYSRSAISRFLTEARNTGIVEIRVNHPLRRSPELEATLCDRFGLREARVLVRHISSYSETLARLGRLAARLVEQHIREETVLGISWGTAVYEVVNALRPRHAPHIRVVQLIGALDTEDPRIDGPELARWLARLFGGRYQTLSAPLIVDTEAVRNALLRDSRMRNVLEQARDVDLAIVGIGTTNPEMSSLVRAGYMTAEEISEVAATGAVGDVCGIHFDVQGHVLDIPITQRIVGIQAYVLRRIPFVLGVAAGDTKVPAILGAVRAGLVNVLVTDDITAQQVLALDQK